MWLFVNDHPCFGYIQIKYIWRPIHQTQCMLQDLDEEEKETAYSVVILSLAQPKMIAGIFLVYLGIYIRLKS